MPNETTQPVPERPVLAELHQAMARAVGSTPAAMASEVAQCTEEEITALYQIFNADSHVHVSKTKACCDHVKSTLSAAYDRRRLAEIAAQAPPDVEVRIPAGTTVEATTLDGETALLVTCTDRGELIVEVDESKSPVRSAVPEQSAAVAAAEQSQATPEPPAETTKTAAPDPGPTPSPEPVTEETTAPAEPTESQAEPSSAADTPAKPVDGS